MPNIIIIDTSTLILFDKINELNLLQKVYKELVITPEIAEEFGENLPNWIKIHSVTDKKYKKFLETQIDKGEASAVALATEYDDVLLIFDDLRARKLAKQLEFRITCTLGVIHKAKQMSIINRVKPLINKLLKTDFRVANNIVEEIFRVNDE